MEDTSSRSGPIPGARIIEDATKEPAAEARNVLGAIEDANSSYAGQTLAASP